MKLIDVDFNDSLQSTIYAERYLNDTKGNFQDYSQVDVRFDPQGNLPFVDLPYTFLTPAQCAILSSEPASEIENWVKVDNNFRFLWHPDVARPGFEIAGSVRTQPTSSTRTLLTEDAPRVYIKTDLDKKHFRFNRRLQGSSVEHSLAICRDLRSFAKNLPPDSRYSFLPESLGLVIKDGPHEGSGVLFREIAPHPFFDDGPKLIVPYHSLYAEDPNAPEDKPLLVQIVEMNAGKSRRDKVQYFSAEIAGPVLESWVLLVSQRGLLPELHGQNTLAEVNKDFTVSRAVHRDFQGTYSDSRLRTNLGLPLFTKHVAGSESGTTLRSQFSHIFDGMIGRYLLLRLSKTFSRYFETDLEEVAESVKQYHHSLSGWDQADFPDSTYRFGQMANQQIDNEVELVDSGEKPMFR